MVDITQNVRNIGWENYREMVVNCVMTEEREESRGGFHSIFPFLPMFERVAHNV